MNKNDKNTEKILKLSKITIKKILKWKIINNINKLNKYIIRTKITLITQYLKLHVK